MTDVHVRKAFEQFMMSGKKTATTTSSSSVAQVTKRLESKEEVLWKKAEQRYWQILKAFQGTLERDWLRVDDNLHDVVSSIANLRGRISMESSQLTTMESNNSPKQWDGYGYHHPIKSSGVLWKEDVELALSHDLLQHEKMLMGARTLLAALSDAQEALGRRLEEAILHNMEMQCMPWTSVVDRLQEVFCALAMELYRKQLLVQSLLNSVNDDLLLAVHQEHDVDAELNPRRVADKCCRDWPRGSKSSHVNVQMLEGLLKLGERGDDIK